MCDGSPCDRDVFYMIANPRFYPEGYLFYVGYRENDHVLLGAL